MIRIFIPSLILDPDRGVKKALDPGSGIRTVWRASAPHIPALAKAAVVAKAVLLAAPPPCMSRAEGVSPVGRLGFV